MSKDISFFGFSVEGTGSDIERYCLTLQFNWVPQQLKEILICLHLKQDTLGHNCAITQTIRVFVQSVLN